MKKENLFIDFLIFIVMLIAAIIFATTTVAGCRKHRSQEAADDLRRSEVRNLAGYFVSEIKSHPLPDVFKDRCDNLTFMGHASGTGFVRFDFRDFEKNGQFFRDVDPCYPEYSLSTISLDGYMGLLHHAVAYRDSELVDRIIAFGEANGWIVGDAAPGNLGLVTIPQLAPIAYMVKRFLSDGPKANFNLTDDGDDGGKSEAYRKLLSGFNGHLLASYLWLRLRTVGYLYDVELTLALELLKAGPRNPIYSAIVYRATTGNQSNTLNLLQDLGRFPDEEANRGELLNETGIDGWGGCPAMVEYLIATAIIEGR